MTASRPFYALLIAGAALPAALIAGQTAAQTTATKSFAIPAQPLEAALLAYMRQSGVQVGYEAADVAGRQSTAISGALPVGEALSRLLGGSGLTYRTTGGTAVRLQPIPQAGGGATQLGPVRVQGAGGAAGGPIETATGPAPDTARR